MAFADSSLRKLAVASPPALSREGFKAVRRLADEPFVQRSSLVVAMVLALSAATVGGVGFHDTDASGSSSLQASGCAEPASDRHASDCEQTIAKTLPGSYGAAGLPVAGLIPDYTIRRTVPEVRLEFTVADEHGRAVTDVSPSDIRILDDQHLVSEIQKFEQVNNLPLRIGLVLDVSDSMRRAIPQEKSAALAFLRSVVRPETDRALVMAFGEGVEIWQEPTSKAIDLAGAVSRVRQAGDATEFYDAMYSACVDQWRPEINLAHRVIVVISDGEDNGSLHGLNDVIAAAVRNEIQIFALSVHQKKRSYPGDNILQKLSDETGGSFFVATSSKQVESVFAQLALQMRTQYYVSFRPLRQVPGYHTLKLEIQAPQKLQVHARHGYYMFDQ